MKIAVIGANGKAWSLITNEAVARGHEVTAIVRSENKTNAQSSIKKDALNLTKEDLKDFDVVVNAFGAWTPETLPQHKLIAQHLVNLLSNTQTRLMVVGGAWSLFVDPEHTIHLGKTPNFPEIFLPVSNASLEAYNIIVNASEVNWTYVTPPANFKADWETTGEYLLGTSEFFLNSRGESQVSYADYALAMVDLIESNGHNQQIVSVNSK